MNDLCEVDADSSPNALCSRSISSIASAAAAAAHQSIAAIDLMEEALRSESLPRQHRTLIQRVYGQLMATAGRHVSSQLAQDADRLTVVWSNSLEEGDDDGSVFARLEPSLEPANYLSNEATETIVASAVASLLGHEVLRDQPLMDAGISSSHASLLVQSLRAEFNVVLPPTLLFDHPSVKSVAEFVIV